MAAAAPAVGPRSLVALPAGDATLAGVAAPVTPGAGDLSSTPPATDHPAADDHVLDLCGDGFSRARAAGRFGEGTGLGGDGGVASGLCFGGRAYLSVSRSAVDGVGPGGTGTGEPMVGGARSAWRVVRQRLAPGFAAMRRCS